MVKQFSVWSVVVEMRWGPKHCELWPANSAVNVSVNLKNIESCKYLCCGLPLNLLVSQCCFSSPFLHKKFGTLSVMVVVPFPRSLVPAGCGQGFTGLWIKVPQANASMCVSTAVCLSPLIYYLTATECRGN